MGELRQRLSGDIPLFAVNPGGPGLTVGDALARHTDAALFIDCERTAIGISEAAQMARAARAAGLTTLLRTETDAAGDIVRYLDCRIDALVVPQVESAAQCGALGQILAIHAATAPRTALIAQIESVAGHEALDAIATHPCVDTVLIGPNDLAASMEHPGQPDHPEVKAAVNDIAARLLAHNMPFGLPVTRDTARDWQARGARLFYIPLAQILTAGLPFWRTEIQ